MVLGASHFTIVLSQLLNSKDLMLKTTMYPTIPLTSTTPSLNHAPQSDSRNPTPFEGLPVEIEALESPLITENATPADLQKLDPETSSEAQNITVPMNKWYAVEINESLALAWAAKFASKDTIFQKNFSLLGVSEGEDSPLWLKGALNVYTFYASGPRYWLL
ncbi:hypothetical protein ARALYDRAFT_898398 [Arabidopsis lyrata subsp. lyrata]|uniref:Uncharacterized protein n=1 Tax=Arabidopsis lyrata subsp. lyrata TaxID=81972 RepID=D7LAU4_ARALL|nr:hypothetical protein ARALYDRAFT_898398 [Arabidopsis lyrata subsp. lyrata]